MVGCWSNLVWDEWRGVFGCYDAKSIFELNICVTRCISIANKGPIGMTLDYRAEWWVDKMENVSEFAGLKIQVETLTFGKGNEFD